MPLLLQRLSTPLPQRLSMPQRQRLSTPQSLSTPQLQRLSTPSPCVHMNNKDIHRPVTTSSTESGHPPPCHAKTLPTGTRDTMSETGGTKAAVGMRVGSITDIK